MPTDRFCRLNVNCKRPEVADRKVYQPTAKSYRRIAANLLAQRLPWKITEQYIIFSKITVVLSLLII
jgi:hypothetical protein